MTDPKCIHAHIDGLASMDLPEGHAPEVLCTLTDIGGMVCTGEKECRFFSAEAENVFGKTHGRFDEAAARASDRMLPERAIGVIVPMPPAEFDAFVRLFNDVFGRDGRPRRFEIREIGRS